MFVCVFESIFLFYLSVAVNTNLFLRLQLLLIPTLSHLLLLGISSLNMSLKLFCSDFRLYQLFKVEFTDRVLLGSTYFCFTACFWLSILFVFVCLMFSLAIFNICDLLIKFVFIFVILFI